MKSILDFIMSDKMSPEIAEELTKGIRSKSVAKGTVLQSKGSTKHLSFFVKKGLLRSYTLDEKGKEHVFMFAPEGWVVGDIESLSNDKPTVLIIDALENTEVDILDSKSFNIFINLPPDVQQERISKLVRRISVLQNRVLMLMSASAAERYQEFVKTYPNIIQRVPQRMVASYLGITPEALSKIRGQMAKGESRTFIS